MDLIGREAELTLVAERLRDRRLVTLIGPGGIGKTALARAAAATCAGDFGEGPAPSTSPGSTRRRAWLRRWPGSWATRRSPFCWTRSATTPCSWSSTTASTSSRPSATPSTSSSAPARCRRCSPPAGSPRSCRARWWCRSARWIELMGGAVDERSTGELIDDTARRAYEQRVRDLQRELDEAEDANDRGRAERARRRSPSGCGPRSAASTSCTPGSGGTCTPRSARTFCSYTPEEPVRWQL